METYAANQKLEGTKEPNASSAPLQPLDEENLSTGTETPTRYRIRELLLVLALIFIPMLTVSFVLLGFMFWASTHVIFPDNGNADLPVNLSRISKDSYYTTIGPSRIALVSGWASHASFFVMPWFMILFSYFVARDVASQRPSYETIRDTREIRDLMNSLLKGSWKETWTWLKFSFQEKSPEARTELRALHMAAAGMIITLVFSVLLIAGETWMHLAVSSSPLRVYDDISRPSNDIYQWSNLSSLWESGSFVVRQEQCNTTISQARLDPFAASDFRPCSLNQTTSLYNVADSQEVYIILQSGITPIATEFNGYSRILSQLVSDVTHVDPTTNITHAFYFYQSSTLEVGSDDGSMENIGVDYLAQTTSMSTACTPITRACQMFNATNSTNQSVSIPFNCSSMFSGDLSVAPTDGLEQFKGWYTSFYEMSGGIPRNISVASQLNPFRFNVTAAVTSTSLKSLIEDEEPDTDPDISNGLIVDAGNDRVAFALSCSATIYDVKYSLINGSITHFNATMSDPRKASIIKAPLQVGFGRHSLFQSASLAVLLNLFTTETLLDAMSVSFSEIGMALSFGAFNISQGLEVRYRADELVTRVPKAPLWFVVVICLLYAALGTVVAAAALYLRSVTPYSNAQVELLPREPIDLKKLALGGIMQIKELLKPEGGWKSMLPSNSHSSSEFHVER